MALSPDQRAMLQLLLERGQSYEDIAGVLGTGRDEVRRRARAALEELAGQDPDAEVGITDYLLGQADPIGRADAARQIQTDAETRELVEELRAKLRLIAPEAELPDAPGPRASTRLSRLPRPPRVQPIARAGLSRRQARILATLGASAVILVVAVLAIAGAFSADDGEEEAATPAPAGEELVRVQLQPEGASEGSGRAVFGLTTGDQPYLDVSVQRLEQAPQGSTYVIWFLLTERRAYPLAPFAPGANGSFSNRYAIPQVVLPLAVRTRFVAISLVDNAELAGDLRNAIEGQNVLLPYQGETVLRGAVPEPPQQDAEGG